MALQTTQTGNGRPKGILKRQRFGRMASESSLRSYRSRVGHGSWQCSKQWQTQNLLEGTSEGGSKHHAERQDQPFFGEQIRRRLHAALTNEPHVSPDDGRQPPEV